MYKKNGNKVKMKAIHFYYQVIHSTMPIVQSATWHRVTSRSVSNEKVNEMKGNKSSGKMSARNVRRVEDSMRIKVRKKQTKCDEIKRCDNKSLLFVPALSLTCDSVSTIG